MVNSQLRNQIEKIQFRTQLEEEQIKAIGAELKISSDLFKRFESEH